MTSAPRSPRVWVQNGPARTLERSNTFNPSSGDFDGSYWTQTLTPSRRLESVPIAVISPQFLGEDAGTDYPYGVQNENEINAIQLRLVAEVTR